MRFEQMVDFASAGYYNYLEIHIVDPDAFGYAPDGKATGMI